MGGSLFHPPSRVAKGRPDSESADSDPTQPILPSMGPILLIWSRDRRIGDPAEADKLLKIQRDLDETKIILHKTIDSVLARGEKLDSLVEKSSDLSAASQVSAFL
ncbi:hypothetical protein Taro_027413 [Colocasia esculenta]|uniref:V-SNARE coiled-coil homology domain-containing protein n=1 Tax=Colocasia esculenta TaxID=4460 RepID=A0A843VMH0_COLES|nr:hypothetical protein [Colocasia esculenta]